MEFSAFFSFAGKLEKMKNVNALGDSASIAATSLDLLTHILDKDGSGLGLIMDGDGFPGMCAQLSANNHQPPTEM